MVKFDIRKRKEVVSLSGIRVGILSLLGAHQALITRNTEKKRADGFEELLYDCIEYLGAKQKPALMLSDIKRLLEPDRKYLLMHIRQLSNNDDPRFVFDYEFPTEEGRKLKERKVVDFNKENFPVKPFYWVRDRIKEQSGENDQPQEEALAYGTLFGNPDKFPIMFEDYAEILDQFFTQKFVLPEAKVEVQYNLLTAEESAKHAGIVTKDTINSHTQILMRNPVYVDDDLSKGREKPVFCPLPLDKLTHMDIEALRKDIMEKEGSVDSTIVVQYKEDRAKQSEIDLVGMPAFFFPSLVI
jgi:hypothetical protein